MLPFLVCHGFHERIELVQTSAPHSPLLLEPGVGLLQRSEPQFTHPDATLFPRHHDFAGLENTQMFHKAGERHAMTLRQISDAGRTARKLPNHRSTGPVGQGMKNAIKVSHTAYYCSPQARCQENYPYG